MSFKFLWLILVIFISRDAVHAANNDQDKPWHYWADRLTGESDKIRYQAIRKLRTVKNAEKVLLNEMNGHRRHLALDAMVVLGNKSLFQPLLSRSHQDEDGQIHLTLNALAKQPAQVESLKKLYFSHLRASTSDTTSKPIIRMIALETLARLNESLTPEHLEYLLTDPHPDLRMAVLSYLRAMVKKNPSPSKIKRFLPVIKKSIKLQPYSLRIQTLYLIREFSLQEHFKSYDCQAERAEVKSVCAELLIGGYQ